MPLSTFESFIGPQVFVGEIEFNWAPEPALIAARLEKAARDLEDLESPLRLAREVAIQDMEHHFDTETSPAGEGWWPLSAGYAARRGEDHPILDLTGEMRGAATDRGSYPVMRDSLFIDTSGWPEYWAWHQEGTKPRLNRRTRSAAQSLINSGFKENALDVVRSTMLVPRPFVGLSEEAQITVVDVFDQWFGGIIEGVGGPLGGRAIPRSFSGRFMSMPRINR